MDGSFARGPATPLVARIRAKARRAAAALALVVAAACVALAPSAAAAADGPELPKRYSKYPLSVQSLSVGSPNSGTLVRPKKLRSAGALRVQAKSQEHAYGLPALVLMLQRTAREMAKAAPGSTLLVGDLSRREGGPLGGHASHQSGRDADVGFYARQKGKPLRLTRFVAFDTSGNAKDGSGAVFDERRNWLLVRMWLQDRRAGIDHVFVARWLRQRLLDYAARVPSERRYVERASELLHQPIDSSPHDDHFHVRIGCPASQSDICRDAGPRRRAPATKAAGGRDDE